jgi:hypothetical protein
MKALQTADVAIGCQRNEEVEAWVQYPEEMVSETETALCYY